eukprot:1161579-Pelagomonas_calceolata.AAC.12
MGKKAPQTAPAPRSLMDPCTWRTWKIGAWSAPENLLHTLIVRTDTAGTMGLQTELAPHAPMHPCTQVLEREVIGAQAGSESPAPCMAAPTQ